MKTKKPKRIRAVKCDMSTGDGMIYLGHDKSCAYTEQCYLLKQSDIRALAEQIEDAWLRECCRLLGLTVAFYKPDRPTRVKGLLYALKRAGMTPGKAGAK